MNYKEKYKQALERAKEELKVCGSQDCDAVRQIFRFFPELRESEDERIRNALITHCRNIRCVTEEGAECVTKWISWLEKQAEKESDPRYENLEDLRTADTIYQMAMNDAMVEEAKSKAVNALSKLSISKLLGLEKQGEQKPIFNADDWYVSKVDGKIHNIYQSVDKIEPKFRVGDWITDGYVGGQITSIEDNYPCYKIADFMGGINTSIPLTLQDNYHLWTINDAKDGDVLVDSYSKDSIIILYKGIYKERTILAHCGWNGYNLTVNTNGFGYGGLDNTNYLPATKEQRDLLFSKIKQADYEWDAEKKELKKNERR